MVCSKKRGESVPRTPRPIGHMLFFPVSYASSPSCLWGSVSSSSMGTGMEPIPSITFAID